MSCVTRVSSASERSCDSLSSCAIVLTFSSASMKMREQPIVGTDLLLLLLRTPSACLGWRRLFPLFYLHFFLHRHITRASLSSFFRQCCATRCVCLQTTILRKRQFVEDRVMLKYISRVVVTECRFLPSLTISRRILSAIVVSSSSPLLADSKPFLQKCNLNAET